MRPIRRSILRTATAGGLAALAIGALPAAAQTTGLRPGWSIAAGYSGIDIGESNGWGDGGELVVRRTVGRHLALQGRFIGIASSRGFYDFGGLALDLGLRAGYRSGAVEIAVDGGARGLAGGDSDGSGGGLIGVHLGFSPIIWISSQVGGYARADARLWHTGTLRPSLGAGLVLAF